MRRLLLLSSSSFMVFTLAACATGDPHPMGRGYSSYKEPYKSAPGPTPRSTGYDYSMPANDSVLQDMRYVADDLAQKLDEFFEGKAESIYFRVPEDTVFYNSFDHVLRESLVSRGYILTGTPAEADVSILFTATNYQSPVEPAYTVTNNNSKIAIENVHGDPYKELFLALIIDEQVAVGGYYDVPTYGFIETKSNKEGMTVYVTEDE